MTLGRPHSELGRLLAKPAFDDREHGMNQPNIAKIEKTRFDCLHLLLPMTKSALAHLRSDPIMARLIDRIGPIRYRPERLPPFQSLVHAVIHQQLSGKAAGTILGRFVALFCDSRFPEPMDVLKLSVETLRTAGLSRPKAAYVHEIARKTV